MRVRYFQKKSCASSKELEQSLWESETTLAEVENAQRRTQHHHPDNTKQQKATTYLPNLSPSELAVSHATLKRTPMMWSDHNLICNMATHDRKRLEDLEVVLKTQSVWLLNNIQHVDNNKNDLSHYGDGDAELTRVLEWEGQLDDIALSAAEQLKPWVTAREV